MSTINLSKYGPLISDRMVGEQISQLITGELDRDQNVELDLNGIKSMATFCSKQIFGRLYLLLGSENFFNRVKISNATDDIKLLIQIGIENALEEHERGPVEAQS